MKKRRNLLPIFFGLWVLGFMLFSWFCFCFLVWGVFGVFWGFLFWFLFFFLLKAISVLLALEEGTDSWCSFQPFHKPL